MKITGCARKRRIVRHYFITNFSGVCSGRTLDSFASDACICQNCVIICTGAEVLVTRAQFKQFFRTSLVFVLNKHRPRNSIGQFNVQTLVTATTSTNHLLHSLHKITAHTEKKWFRLSYFCGCLTFSNRCCVKPFFICTNTIFPE